jgi:hypothetical protein
MKMLFALTLALLATEATAQQRTIYDSSGKVVGRAATDSQGTTTVYDSRGTVVGKESKSGNTTTIYDAGGRKAGSIR